MQEAQTSQPMPIDPNKVIFAIALGGFLLWAITNRLKKISA